MEMIRNREKIINKIKILRKNSLKIPPKHILIHTHGFRGDELEKELNADRHQTELVGHSEERESKKEMIIRE